MTDLRSELLKVYEKRGMLNPPIVVEEATPEDSPLHGEFNWDNDSAAHEHRLEQARRLLARVRITYTTPKGERTTIRAFHAIPRPDTPRPSYEPVEKITADPVLTEILLTDMKRQWVALKRRFEQFDEFRTMILTDLGIDAA